MGGSRAGKNLYDVWSSETGETWEIESPNFAATRDYRNYQLLVVKNELWIVTETEILKSSDGRTWTGHSTSDITYFEKSVTAILGNYLLTLSISPSHEYSKGTFPITQQLMRLKLSSDEERSVASETKH